ncbi:Uncharacterised protein [Vibrio furnissii]|nr:Uncharacterised protein [Vibrio furnissii]
MYPVCRDASSETLGWSAQICTMPNDNSLLKLLSLFVGVHMKYWKDNKLRKHLSIALLFVVYLGVLTYLSKYIV